MNEEESELEALTNQENYEHRASLLAVNLVSTEDGTLIRINNRGANTVPLEEPEGAKDPRTHLDGTVTPDRWYVRRGELGKKDGLGGGLEKAIFLKEYPSCDLIEFYAMMELEDKLPSEIKRKQLRAGVTSQWNVMSIHAQWVNE